MIRFSVSGNVEIWQAC